MTVELNVRVAVGMTFTTALVSEVPPVPLQLSEYEVAIATAPVLWLPLRPTEPFQAPLAVQSGVARGPCQCGAAARGKLPCGDAVKVTVGTGKMVTVVTTGAVTPPGPAQMSEYAVAAVNGPCCGYRWQRLCAPAAEALHEVALVELHVSMEAFPERRRWSRRERAVGAGIGRDRRGCRWRDSSWTCDTIEYTLVAMIGPCSECRSRDCAAPIPDAAHEVAWLNSR